MTHSCGYHCTRPECVIAQRDELLGRLEAKSVSLEACKEVSKAMSEFWHQDVELLRQALEALHRLSGWQSMASEPDQDFARQAIAALRERLWESGKC